MRRYMPPLAVYWAMLVLFVLPATSAHSEPPCGYWTKFDDRGVAIFDYGGEIGTQHNATTVSQIAKACLDRYAIFKLPQDWTTATAQIDWLRNNAVSLSDDAAVYVHNFPWSMGLKPGWRSGSSQMNAIRAMILYYRASGDKSILQLIRRLKNGMMLPVSKGGTVATSPEGGIWIEEFPTDPPSLVLGSFIDTTIVLHQVATLFPDDERSRAEFDAAVASLKMSLKEYDTGNWTLIYRWAGRKEPALADEVYGPAFPRLMGELAEITKDQLFLVTSLRWRSFYEDVNVRSAGNVRMDSDGKFRVGMELPKREMMDVLKDNNARVLSVEPEAIPGFGPDKLFDDDMNTYLSLSSGPARIQLQVKSPQLVNTLKLGLYNVELYPEDLQIEIRPEGGKDFERIPAVVEASRRFIYYHFDPIWAEEVRITASRFSQQNRLVLADLALGTANWNNRQKASSCSHTTEPVELKAPAFRIAITAPPESDKQIFVIYRHAVDRAGIGTSPWQWAYVDPSEPRDVAVTDPKEMVYQFRVLCTPEAGRRGWKGLSVLNVKGEVAYHEGGPTQ